MCTEYSIVRTIRLKNSLMPHKHLKRQNVIQLHQSSDLNSNKTITECLTDKTRHVTAAQCIYNLHHGCSEDFPSRRKTLLYYLGHFLGGGNNFILPKFNPVLPKFLPARGAMCSTKQQYLTFLPSCPAKLCCLWTNWKING